MTERLAIPRTVTQLNSGNMHGAVCPMVYEPLLCTHTLPTLTQWLQMGQRVFMIALMVSICVALPTTGLVVPEGKHAGTSGAEVLAPSLALYRLSGASYLRM
jgi:hypothetical protein